MRDKKKVLLVEDDVFIGGMIADQITTRGMELTRVTSGDKVLPTMRHNMPDVVALDLFIPNMSGLDVLRAIRADEKTQKVPVLVLTNTDQASDKKAVQDLGAKFLSKSLTTPAKIVDYIEGMLK